MALSKKDYVAIAGILNQTMRDYPGASQEMTIGVIRSKLSHYFESNPNFAAELFHAAVYKK